MDKAGLLKKLEAKSNEAWDKMGSTGSDEYFKNMNEENYWFGYYRAIAEQIRNDALEDVINMLLSYDDLFGVDLIAAIRNLKTNGNGSSEGGKDDK